MSKANIATALLLAAAALTLSSPATSGVLDPPPAYPQPSPAYPYPSPAYPAKAAYMPPAPPVYDWTGFYIGVNGGGSMGRTNWSSELDGTSGSVSRSSGLVGGTIGYNMQNLGALVVGGEFDFDWRRMYFTIPAAICGPTCELHSNWVSTARLRLGYQVDRFLPYLTGGLSMADFTAYSFGQPNGTNRSVSFNFTAGAGIEFVLTGPLTGKVEYLYVNHNGNNSADVNGQNCIVQCNGPVNFGPKENIVRVGLNYRLWER
jgi:outer membrane immunogenic protein